MIITCSMTAIILVVISIYIYYLRKSQQAIKEIIGRNIPYESQPSFVKVLLFNQRIELLTQEKINRVGKIYGFNMLGGINLMIAEPELIQLVLNKEFSNFPNRRKFYTNDFFFTNSLPNVELDQWKRLRAIVAPTFATGKLRQIKPKIDSICQTLIQNINNHLDKSHDQIINVKKFAGAFTMDVVIQVAFGVKVDSLIEPDNLIIKNARKLFSVDVSMKNIITLWLILFSPKFLRKLFRNLRINGTVIDFFKKFSLEIIQQKQKEYAHKNYTKASTFIEFLLEAENRYKIQQEQLDEKNGHLNEKKIHMENEKKLVKYMTSDEMVAQCILFFLAGYDTTATAITTACYHLALNPDKQQLAYEEIIRVISEQISEQVDKVHDYSLELISFDSFTSKFEYVTGVINETLRISPPAIFTERRVQNNFTLSTNDKRYNVLVKKDDIIQIPIWNLHHNEEYFPEPEKFRPERFCQETGHNFPKYAYLPFGSGPRACVAKSLALIEIKMALIWLIKNFKFLKCEKTMVPIKFYNQNGLLIPRDIFLKVERR